jgi:hypothetical protein
VRGDYKRELQRNKKDKAGLDGKYRGERTACSRIRTGLDGLKTEKDKIHREDD